VGPAIAADAIGRTDEPRACTTEVASCQSDRHPLLNGFPPAGARTAGPVTQDNGGVFDSDRDAPGRAAAAPP
jgi:hypothetical protein